MKILLKTLSGQAFSGSCSNNMCQSKVILDTDNFWNVKDGMEVLIHEYGHILDFLINQILNNQNQHFDSRKYLISSLANDTKITNEAYQKLLAYGVVRSLYGRVPHLLIENYLLKLLLVELLLLNQIVILDEKN